jgi:hypothetical protein
MAAADAGVVDLATRNTDALVFQAEPERADHIRGAACTAGITAASNAPNTGIGGSTNATRTSGSANATGSTNAAGAGSPARRLGLLAAAGDREGHGDGRQRQCSSELHRTWPRCAEHGKKSIR